MIVIVRMIVTVGMIVIVVMRMIVVMSVTIVPDARRARPGDRARRAVLVHDELRRRNARAQNPLGPDLVA